MATLGELERSIMDLLWDADSALAANDLRDALAGGGTGGPALTTVLTVLSRLENKGFASRDRDTRPHLYQAAMSRADHMAELMHDVLGSAPDHDAVLARFVGQVSPDDVASLRRMLDGVQPR